MIKTIISIILLILSLGCSETHTMNLESSREIKCEFKNIAQTQKVSLLELIANAKDFDNKCVWVIGKLDARSQSSALYLNNNDREHALVSNAIKIVLSDDQVSKFKRDNGLNYSVVGRFQSYERNKNIYNGVIVDITEIKFDG